MDALGVEILIIIFFIAVLYSSVGFGGGSSYQALFALVGVNHILLRFTSLVCNLAVVSSGTYLFSKKGYLNLKTTLPLTMASVPAAYLGGRVTLAQDHYFILLACVLSIISIILFFHSRPPASQRVNGSGVEYLTPKIKLNAVHNSFIGGSLGFLAGLVGIGGGIFLAPILHFIRWDKAKAIAAASSFFILVNSVAGLLGQYSQKNPSLPYDTILHCAASVFIGGQIGTRLSIRFFSEAAIKKITAIFVLFVAVRLFVKYL